MPRYSRVLYHQKGPRTAQCAKLHGFTCGSFCRRVRYGEHLVDQNILSLMVSYAINCLYQKRR